MKRGFEGLALRAGLVSRAEQWRRSSLSRWHQKPQPLPKLLSPWPIPGLANWIERVNEPRNDKELEDVRRCAHRGQPSGDEGWTESIGRRSTVETRINDVPRGTTKKVDTNEKERKENRGRDGHCWPPPAQIRTGRTTAYGSYRRC